MGTHRNEWEKLIYSKISQNKTPDDSKVTSSLGFSSKNLLEWYFNVVKKKKNIKHKNKHHLHRKYGTFWSKWIPKYPQNKKKTPEMDRKNFIEDSDITFIINKN